MEFWLLYKLGIVVGGVVKAGYVFAGSYFVRIGYQYIQDYREAVARESEVK